MNLTQLRRILRNRRIFMIVVPTADIVANLIEEFKVHNHLDPDIDKLVDIIMQSIGHKALALEYLQKTRDDYERVLNSIDPINAHAISNVFLDVGKRLFWLLDQLDAYENNYLIYHRTKWLGMNLVIEKFDPDEFEQPY